MPDINRVAKPGLVTSSRLVGAGMRVAVRDCMMLLSGKTQFPVIPKKPLMA